jgi:KaiC/GvpD/RAD55 family RecA-like ATPase
MAVEAPRPWYAPAAPPAVRPVVDAVDASPRVPTGVPDFDHLSKGLPAGSVVLLVGEAGAGHQEFALTSAVHMMFHFDDPQLHRFYLGGTRGPFVYPSGIAYVSVSRMQDQVLQEVAGAFEPAYREVLARHLSFHDLSPSYFADSVVPSTWASVPSPLLSAVPAGRRANSDRPLAALAEALESAGPSNLVIVDSLTDLLVRRGVDTEELLTLVKGLRRRAKAWGGLVYLLLSRGVAPAATEQALYDSVDGVLAFSWTTSAFHSHRQRTMLIEKFMPVLTRVPSEHHGRFTIQVSAVNGLVTTQYERV